MPLTLTPEIVADNERLALAVDHVIETHPEFEEQLEGLTRLQTCFREAVPQDLWQTYLLIDEADGAWFSEALLVVAQWAFGEGLRFGGPRP